MWRNRHSQLVLTREVQTWFSSVWCAFNPNYVLPRIASSCIYSIVRTVDGIKLGREWTSGKVSRSTPWLLDQSQLNPDWIPMRADGKRIANPFGVDPAGCSTCHIPDLVSGHFIRFITSPHNLSYYKQTSISVLALLLENLTNSTPVHQCSNSCFDCGKMSGLLESLRSWYM